MAIQADPQRGLWDIEIENEHLEELLDIHELTAKAAKDHRKAKREMKQELAALELGTRYRIGRYVVTPRVLSGGPVEIPVWDSRTYGIEALD